MFLCLYLNLLNYLVLLEAKYFNLVGEIEITECSTCKTKQTKMKPKSRRACDASSRQEDDFKKHEMPTCPPLN